MEYRQFGQTDLRVSAIGFGCWEIGGTYGRIDEALFTSAVQRAIDSGINCFDTAEAYGMGVSEQALARALGGRRWELSGDFGHSIRELTLHAGPRSGERRRAPRPGPLTSPVFALTRGVLKKCTERS